MEEQIDILSLNDLIIQWNIEIMEINIQIDKLKKLQSELDNIKQDKKPSKKVKKIIIEK
jgi:hypothetical protein